MFETTGGAAIFSGVCLLLVAMLGAIVELRKTRVAQKEGHEVVQRVEHEVRPNTGGSMRDAVDRATRATDSIGGKLDKIVDSLHDIDKRLTKVETRSELMVTLHPGSRERETPNGQ